MALTKQWSKLAILGVPNTWNPDYAYRGQGSVGPAVEGSTLLRTIAEFELSVFVPNGGSQPPAQWWSEAYVEVRVTWTHDGSFPTLDVEGALEGDLGTALLYPTFVGTLGTTTPSQVLFKQAAPIDVSTMRKPGATDTPAVWVAIYYGDPTSALGPSFDTDARVTGYLRTLWGHA